MSNKAPLSLNAVSAIVVEAKQKVERIPAHLATTEDLASRLKVYPVANKPGHFRIAVDAPTCPLAILTDEHGNWTSNGSFNDREGDEEDREEMRKLLAQHLLTNAEVQAQAKAFLIARNERLTAQRLEKEAQKQAAKAVKASLAQGATTAIAATAIADSVANDE